MATYVATGFPDEPIDERERIAWLVANLPFANPMNIRFRFMRNRKSGKTHTTIDGCIPAVSMRLENREYTDDIPDVVDFCGFCRPKFEKRRDDSVNEYR